MGVRVSYFCAPNQQPQSRVAAIGEHKEMAGEGSGPNTLAPGRRVR
jgi:hypothetical protein